ncbi:trna(ile)-lysidine synthase, chloroplastic [Nicotiana attenuata]|uniref:tRNA(Ile)-lysidine synthetase n=2 Tax=Nicotiana attenuata TaxID=49451 RepID=A0A1J6JX28_NICAT|nr:trna(ile)-lysidine synthase, chloroplastic [Nicotiana attenuata]
MSAYSETFSKRMAMAGLRPHHRIVLGVSGGPDSMALCVLTAAWKTNSLGIAAQKNEFIDGLLAVVVDHGLRAESKDEANLVHRRVTSMGIKCEIASCEWSEGKPKQGHLQEAAREKRYEILQSASIRHQIGVLMTAHHADDQAELFILRLSRNSGVLGLAGMAFVSQLFCTCPDLSAEASGNGILLVRPLLEFSKEDMYKICLGANQEWVEDPTNRSTLFTRNRIRMTLTDLSSPIFRSELQALIAACRRTRLHVDRICSNLMHQAVTIMPEGDVVIDLGILRPSELKDIVLSKFIALLLQFVSQRQRPVRGRASKLLLDYIRTSPCKTAVTASGCYLCPAPGSKGTKVLVCCSTDADLALEFLNPYLTEGKNCSISNEVEQIVANGRSYSDQFPQNTLGMQFLDLTSSDSILVEAKREGILGQSTYKSIISLQREESNNFVSKTNIMLENMVQHKVYTASAPSKVLHPEKVGYFMNRFIVKWNLRKQNACTLFSMNNSNQFQDFGEEKWNFCNSCLVGHDQVARVRCMVDADWLYLATLSKRGDSSSLHEEELSLSVESRAMSNINLCSACTKKSAERALLLLKSIPVAARRVLPVLVNVDGVLLSIPCVGFQHCPCLVASATFKPKIPLGGGYNSFL